MTKKILNQASMEAHHKSCLRGVLDKAVKDGKDVWSFLYFSGVNNYFQHAADEHLMAVVLLPDVRSTPSYEHVVYFIEVN